LKHKTYLLFKSGLHLREGELRVQNKMALKCAKKS